MADNTLYKLLDNLRTINEEDKSDDWHADAERATHVGSIDDSQNRDEWYDEKGSPDEQGAFDSAGHFDLEKAVNSQDVNEAKGNVFAGLESDIASFLANDELSDELYDAAFDYFTDNGLMPYGVAKARTGDPYQWISNNLPSLLNDLGYDAENILGKIDMNKNDDLTEMRKLSGLYKQVEFVAESERTEKDPEWANSPDEKYYDADVMVNVLAGGPNAPHNQINPNNPADNPMAMGSVKMALEKASLNLKEETSKIEKTLREKFTEAKKVEVKNPKPSTNSKKIKEDVDTSVQVAVRELGLTRKPNRWEEVREIEVYHLPADIQQMLKQLPNYDVDDLGIDNVLDEFFAPPDETVFILTRDFDTYLVNTEGADYCRYISKLIYE